MYVTQTYLGQLNVHESYKCGKLLLETVKMRGLNEFNLKKICTEGEKDNAPSTSSGLSLDNKTKRFEYSIRVNDNEGPKQNHFKKETNGIESKEINTSLLQRLLCPRPTKNQETTTENQETTTENQKMIAENQKMIAENQETTAENQKSTPAEKSGSDLVFLKPRIYQCYYCRKLFFHTSTYRRHMIYELQKLHWCSICKRGFVSKKWCKKHKLLCYVI